MLWLKSGQICDPDKLHSFCIFGEEISHQLAGGLTRDSDDQAVLDTAAPTKESSAYSNSSTGHVVALESRSDSSKSDGFDIFSCDAMCGGVTFFSPLGIPIPSDFGRFFFLVFFSKAQDAINKEAEHLDRAAHGKMSKVLDRGVGSWKIHHGMSRGPWNHP